MQNQELKDRVEAKRHELLAKWNELKADTRSESKDVRASVKTKLDELEESIKDGWDNVTEQAKEKLNRLLNKD